MHDKNMVSFVSVTQESKKIIVMHTQKGTVKYIDAAKKSNEFERHLLSHSLESNVL